MAASLIQRNAVGGWFFGRDELGPRALGNRSIVARADDREVAGRINRIKGREPWRPLAPALLEAEADAAEFGFADRQHLDFMIEARWPAQPTAISAALHADGSTRPLVVERPEHPFHNLLTEVRSVIGNGAVVNTSLNVSGEPLVHSPMDALRTFCGSDLDFLALPDFVLAKPDICE